MSILLLLEGQAQAATRVVDLYTIGVGSYLYARFGHSLLCVSEGGPGTVGDCYDFGVPDPQQAEHMFWRSYRGKPIFITARVPLEVVLATFKDQERTIEKQRLPLSAEETQRLIVALEGSAARGDAYAYHPATANCATRVRDVLNEAVGDRLRKDATPTKEANLRELMEQGLAGHPLELAAAGLVLGPMNERYPSSWELQMVPFALRDAVEERLGAKPERVYERVEYRMEKSASAGRVLFLAFGALLWAGISLGARLSSGKQKRAPLELALRITGLSLGGLALLVELVALTCSYVETHRNWVLLTLLPTDLALGWLPRRRVALYARVRLAMVGVLIVLDVVGVVQQMLLPIALMVALPMLGALFATREAPSNGTTKREPTRDAAVTTSA